MIVTSMITSFLNLISSWMSGIANAVPNISPEGFNTIKQYFDVVRYVIPVGALLPLVLIIVAMQGLRILISFIKLIIDVIPLW